MLSADAIKAIQTTAQQAHAPQIIPMQDDPRRVCAVINGELHEIAVPPPSIDNTADSLQSLLDQAACILAAGVARRCQIWYQSPSDLEDTAGVVLVHDTTDRRDMTRLALRQSQQFLALKSLGKGSRARPMAHREAVRFLRLELGLSPEQIAPFRRLQFSAGQRTDAEVAKGRESLGRQVEASVSGAGEPPEELTISVPVYETHGETAGRLIRLAVDFDPAAQTVTFCPLPGELARAVHAHMIELAARIAAYFTTEEGTNRQPGVATDGLEVYNGRP